MARSTSKISAIATFDVLYESVEQMPWKEIEANSKVVFSDEARVVIFLCANEFPAAFALQEQGAQAKEYEALKKQLLELATNTVDLWRKVERDERRDEYGYRLPDDEVVNAFDQLTWAFSNKTSPRNLLRSMAKSAEELMKCFGDGPAIDAVPSAVQADTAGLAAFILSLLNGAEAQPARFYAGWQENKPAKEYKRWGLSIGSQSEIFRSFAEAVLQREIKRKSLKAGFELARVRVHPKHPHFLSLSQKKGI